MNIGSICTGIGGLNLAFGGDLARWVVQSLEEWTAMIEEIAG